MSSHRVTWDNIETAWNCCKIAIILNSSCRNVRLIDVQEFHSREESVELSVFQQIVTRHIDNARGILLRKWVLDIINHQETSSHLNQQNQNSVSSGNLCRNIMNVHSFLFYFTYFYSLRFYFLSFTSPFHICLIFFISFPFMLLQQKHQHVWLA